MPPRTFVQSNFTSGEWSPKLIGRTDLVKYGNALLTCKNFIATQHGGAIRRSGTKYVATTKYGNRATRLIEFEFSTTQTYVIEFGDAYIRFYKASSQILSGGAPYEISSPYAAADLARIKFTQSADILYLFHPDYPPRQLNRFADDSWTITEFANVDGPYITTNTTVTTMNPSATSGTGITITASVVTGINDDAGFLSTDVGRHLRILHGSTWGYAVITAVGSTTSVTADVVETFGASTAQVTWRLGAWSGTTGYPYAAVFHHGRLWIGGNNKQPQTLWGSVVGDFVNFQPTDTGGAVNDDDGTTYTIDDDQVNAIRWIKSSARGLMIGTSGGAFLGSTSGLDPITPTNFLIRRQTTIGTHPIADPVQVSNVILYPEKGGRRLFEFVFSFEQDQFVAPDMSLLAQHITGTGITDTAFQQEPHSIMWSVRDDGVLLGFSYYREEKVLAWHRHIVGGTLGSGNPKVESIASIREGDFDQLWMVVERTINSVTVKSIEVMQPLFDSATDNQEDAFFVDCGFTYDGVATDNLTGLGYLEGETVTILADGGTHGAKVVEGGSITLDRSASVVHVGYGFNSDGETMPMYVAAKGSDPRGKNSRMITAEMVVNDTLGLKSGISFDDLAEIVYRSPSDPMGSAPPLFTGTADIYFEDGFEKHTKLFFRQSEPLPATILAIYVELDVGGI